MGVRSDVAFCVKNEVYQKLSGQAREVIKEYFGDYNDRSEEGMFFYTEDVKWYHDSFGGLVCLYNELHEQEDDDFLIIQACSEYPTDNDGDLGSWYENPWEICKEVNVSLHWNLRYVAQPKFKVGDYIRCDKMQVEGVVLETSPSQDHWEKSDIMFVRLYCTKDVTYPVNVHQRIKLHIYPSIWEVTNENQER